MPTLKIAILAAVLVTAACGDDPAKQKGSDIVTGTNQMTGPNGETSSGNVATNSGNVATNAANGSTGPTCGYAQSETDGVCRLQDHLWFSVGPTRYEGLSEFEQTTILACSNLAVADAFSPRTPDIEVDGCSLYVDTGMVEPQPSPLERGPIDLGEFTVSIAGEPIALELNDSYCYLPVETLEVAIFDEPLTIAASGGADISAFEESRNLPSSVPVVDAQKLIDATGAVTFSPRGSTAADTHTLTWNSAAGETRYTVVCAYDPGASVTVPASIVSEVRSAGAQSLGLGVTRSQQVRIDSSTGDAHVNGSFTATYGFTF